MSCPAQRCIFLFLEQSHIRKDLAQLFAVFRRHRADGQDRGTGIDSDHGQRLLDDDGEGAQTKGNPQGRQAVLGFERACLLFLFNFHLAKSYTDYPVETTPGEYRLILDSDAPFFGGHGRVASNQTYVAAPNAAGRTLLTAYLPSRTALVLQKNR